MLKVLKAYTLSLESAPTECLLVLIIYLQVPRQTDLDQHSMCKNGDATSCCQQ